MWAARALRSVATESPTPWISSFALRSPLAAGSVVATKSSVPWIMSFAMRSTLAAGSSTSRAWPRSTSFFAGVLQPNPGLSSIGGRRSWGCVIASSRLYASGFSGTRKGSVDIASRARQLQTRRIWTICLSGTVVAGFIIIVLNTFQDNLMFYITPSQALEKYYLDPSKNKCRLGGLVLEGSVHHFTSSAEMEFVVTDLANEILVRYRGALPDLFREGHSVVAEGFLKPISTCPAIPETTSDLHASIAEKAKEAGCYFKAVEVLAKHDEKYMPREVAAAIEKNKAAIVAPQAVLLPNKTVEMSTSGPESAMQAGPRQKSVAQSPIRSQGYEIRP